MVESSAKIGTALEVGIDLIEFTETTSKLNNLLLNQILTPEGLDWFNWFMYEKGAIDGKEAESSLKAYATIDGVEVEIITDAQNLFDYLQTNNYFRCNQK